MNVVTLTGRATTIEFIDTSLTITSATANYMSMAPSTGINNFTLNNANKKYVYNINNISRINNIIGSVFLFAAARGAFKYLQATGGTYRRPTVP